MKYNLICYGILIANCLQIFCVKNFLITKENI
jgi:hypothetical protein